MKNKEIDSLSVYDKCYSFLKNRKAAKQRATKGYCYRDIYSISNWFLRIMPKMLEELKDIGDYRGFPSKFMGDYYDYNTDKIPVNISREEFIKGYYDEEYKELYREANEWCYDHWTDLLAIMIFNFNECDDEKCTKKNEFEEEYRKAKKEFEQKFGVDGEKLMTDEERERCKKTLKDNEDCASCYVPHFMNELPEYKDIYEKYHKREKEIFEYKEDCKKEGLRMFTEYFDDLWW